MRDAAQRARMVILGLDGVGWSLVQDLAAQGNLPHLGRLVREAPAGPMASTRPEVSPVAWTTFFTGAPPGEHGIFGFTEFQGPDYKVGYNSSAAVRVPALWDWLGLSGRRAVVLNVPLTYPARALAGVMVSGFVTPSLARAGFPVRVVEYLQETGYRPEPDLERASEDRAAFLADLEQILAGRVRLLERFWAEEWDLFVLVITETDRLNHFFLRAYEEGGLYRASFVELYRRVDEIVGRVYEQTAELAARAEGEVSLVVLSDHGFTVTRGEFHLNRWLAAQGYQPGVGPEAWALALEPTRIYLNRPPRFARGRVGPAEGRALLEELRVGLAAEPAVAEVLSGEELYPGPARAWAPDLVVQPARGFEFKARFSPGPVSCPSPLEGTHIREEAFFVLEDFGRGSFGPEMRNILDLGQYVFARLGLGREGFLEVPGLGGAGEGRGR